MCENEWLEYRAEFDKAAIKFGWTLHKVEECHERDERGHWTSRVWCNSRGERIADESDMEAGLVEELIRISKIAR